jgi:hypothetical protein
VLYSRRGWTSGIGATQTPAAAARRRRPPALSGARSLRHDVCVDKRSHTVSKIKAEDGRIGTAVPLVLRDTRRSRVEVLPWYIPRSSGMETKLTPISAQEVRGNVQVIS